MTTGRERQGLVLESRPNIRREVNSRVGPAPGMGAGVEEYPATRIRHYRGRWQAGGPP
jgi:hypothetical protein